MEPVIGILIALWIAATVIVFAHGLHHVIEATENGVKGRIVARLLGFALIRTIFAPIVVFVLLCGWTVQIIRNW